jgi:hypothetical protein
VAPALEAPAASAEAGGPAACAVSEAQHPQLTTPVRDPIRNCERGSTRLGRRPETVRNISLTSAYSYRSAILGSILVARQAGMYPAKSAAAATMIAVAPKVMGSAGLTSNKNLRIDVDRRGTTA